MPFVFYDIIIAKIIAFEGLLQWLKHFYLDGDIKTTLTP